ncbi:MAG TPA: site-2 protease family protein [Nannocystis exedens]|nr:site-2 protease family protein [Nannocystis exedens]
MPSKSAIFRPRLTRLGGQAFIAIVFVYFGLKLLSPPIEIVATYPFGVAAMVGLTIFVWQVVFHYRRQGFVVDDTAIVEISSWVRIPFDEVVKVRLEVREVVFGGRTSTARVATVEAKGGATMSFSDLGAGLPWTLDDIVNIDTAGQLLATIVARTGSEALYPAAWRGGVAEGRTTTSEVVEETRSARFTTRAPWSFLAFLIKVVPKFGAMALKLVKTVKPAAVAVTVGAYSLIVSWKFALAFVVLIGIHESGHVFAMWRSGVKVKGIYFIPFFGGVAVGESAARSAARNAYIAVNGPVWGSLFAFLCFAVFLGSGEQWAFVGALAAWGALLNLFNLLPIMPLDGGRILAALGTSRSWGLPLIFTSLVLGASLAYFAHFDLLVLMVIFGLVEFGTTVRTMQSGPCLALLNGQIYGPGEHEHFSSMVAPVVKGRTTDRQIEQRARDFEHYAGLAAQTPMSAGQIAVTGLGYLVLCTCLLGLMWALRDLPGAGNPLQFLH